MRRDSFDADCIQGTSGFYFTFGRHTARFPLSRATSSSFVDVTENVDKIKSKFQHLVNLVSNVSKSHDGPEYVPPTINKEFKCRLPIKD